MNYQSPELANLETGKQPIGPHSPDPIIFDKIKNDIKLIVYLKNKSYQKYFDHANLYTSNTISGAAFLRSMMEIIEFVMLDNNQIDNSKRVQINTYFNIIKSSLNGLDNLPDNTTKEAICASILGVLSKNYL